MYCSLCFRGGSNISKISILILNPFNHVWWGVQFVALFVAFLIYFKRQNKDNRKFLQFLSVLSVVFLCVYKFFYSISNAENIDLGDIIPLHLCNLITFMAIPASFVKSEKIGNLLKGFCFYMGVIFAIVAMVIPEPVYVGNSILSPRMLGFYGYHSLLLILSISFVTIGEYKPKYKDIPKELLLLGAVAGIMHLVNLALRATIFPEANFIYTFGLDGYILAEILQKLIPFQFVWMTPLLLLVGFLCLVLTVIAKLLSRKANAK